MNNSNHKSRTSLVLYFLLALLFAALTIVADRPRRVFQSGIGVGISVDTRWIFWLLLTLSVLCLLPLVAALLRILQQRKALPHFLENFYHEEFQQKARSWLLGLRARLFGRVGLTVIAGIAILVLGIYVHYTGAVDDDAVNGNLHDLALQFRGYQHEPEKFTKIARLEYLTPDNDVEHNLGDCLEIVRKLKTAGAKAVLISLPDFSSALDKCDSLINEIEKSGIVVWGVPLWSTRISWTQVAKVSGGFPHFYSGNYFSESEDMWKGGSVSRVKLAPMTRSGSNAGDVTTMLLQKYLDIPSSDQPTVSNSTVQLADYRIPISKAGWMYSVDWYSGAYWPEFYVHRGLNWRLGRTFWITTGIHSMDLTQYGGDARQLDTLHFSARLKGDGSPKLPVPLDQQTLELNVKDKVVFIVGNYGAHSGHYLPDRAYAVALENILRGRVVSKPNLGYVWYSLACLVLAALLSLRFRALVAILLMFFLAVCALLFASYLYMSQNLLIDLFYPLLSIGIAMIVFPAIVLARKMGSESASIQ